MSSVGAPSLLMRFGIPVGLLALLSGAVVAGYCWSIVPVRFFLPILSTLLALSLVRPVYEWRRTAGRKKRSARRTSEPAEKVEIPVGTRRVQDYEGIAVIHQAQNAFHSKAIEAQARYFVTGIRAAFLPPLALLLLSMQVLLAGHQGPVAVGLIVSEAVCLFYLLQLVWANPAPTNEWSDNRMRGELLRREQYLFLAGVGPYHDKSRTEATEASHERLALVTGSSGEALKELVALGRGAESDWLAKVYAAPAGKVRSDLRSRIETYLFHRIAKQLGWFANEARDCHENERAWTQALKIAALAALVVAILHGRELMVPTQEHLPFGTLITVAGFVLPPLGAALLSVRALYGFHLRHRLYRRTSEVLRRYYAAFEALLDRAKSATQGPEQAEIDRAFQTTVICAELVLSHELDHWLLVMQREELEIGP